MNINNIYKSICYDYAQNKNFSGVCMIKSGNETLISEAYGYANKAFHIANKIDTKFDVASVTKIFTATAILLLVEQGLLKLDDKITDLIDLHDTEIPNDVEIHHLLSHTSGIADDADEENGENYSDLFIEHPNYMIRSCKDFLPNFVYKKPNFKAGTNIRYNNCAFILLGLAIEKVMGMDCRTYMESKIFIPLRMINTKFQAMDKINENTAEGYIAQYNQYGEVIGWKKNIYSYPPIGTPDGGVYTTADDLNTFIKAITTGKLLSKHYMDILLSPQCEFMKDLTWSNNHNAHIKYGYVFEFIEIDGEIFSITKDGINSGVAAIFTFYPKLDLTVTILANQDCNIWQMHRDI